MRTSIIVAAHNEGTLLGQTLQSILDTVGDLECEIIVVDDGSTDQSVHDAMQRFPRVQFLQLKKREGPATSKDLGASEARGETLVFLDAHTKPERGAIRRLVEQVEAQEGQAILLPRILQLNEGQWKNIPRHSTLGYAIDLKTFQTHWKRQNELKPFQGNPELLESPGLIGCCFAMSSKLYEILWGHDRGMRGWGVEDIDLGLKSWLMGNPILVDPSAQIGHRFRTTFDNYQVNLPRVVANQIRMARKNYTESVWKAWVQLARLQFFAATNDYPEGVWTRAWLLFDADRVSADEERAYLLGRRIHDEFWYANYFGLDWPQLSSDLVIPSGTQPLSPPISIPGDALSNVHPYQSPIFGGQDMPFANPNSPDQLMGDSPSSIPCMPWANTGSSQSIGSDLLSDATVLASPPPGNNKPIPAPCPASDFNGTRKSCPIGTSAGPIRYFNGEVQISAVDLSSDGFGATWQHRRTYSNQLSYNGDVGQGYCWLIDLSPYLWADAGGAINFVSGTAGSLTFDLIGSNYVGRYGAKGTLIHDVGARTFTLTQPTGDVWVFLDFTYAYPQGGVFSKHISPGGQATAAMGYNGLGLVTEFQRSSTIGSVTNTESFLYSFNGSSRIATVLLRRQVNGGAWSSVRQVAYTYHTGSDSFGVAGDLKLVEIQIPNGGGWTSIEKTYYRYYTVDDPGTQPGFMHGLKYVINPASYEMMTGLGLDPTTASDATLSMYADFYYEYGFTAIGPTGAFLFQVVRLERVFRGSQTYQFGYMPQGASSTTGGNLAAMKTTEILPDGSMNIVYTNDAGQILLKDFTKGFGSTEPHWIEVWQYGGTLETLHANPSAVVGYTESSFPDPPGDLTITYHEDTGLMRLSTYYGLVPGGGAAPNYLKEVKVRAGRFGSSSLVKSYTYTSYTFGAATVYPVATETVYRNTGGTGAITTSYAYTFFAGTVQIESTTTTLPVISTGHNGSGVAATRQTFLDKWDRPIWLKDERGFITKRSYDQPTGALIQEINDVNTSVVSGAPSGWSTPAGGGLNLTSDYVVDNLGRTTQVLSPNHIVDLAGTANTIRTTTWIVYQDVTHQTWSAQGYITSPSTTYTLVNPVSITITDAQGRVLEQIAATRGSGVTSSGPLLPTDTFPQTSYVRWTTMQYLDCCFVASKRVYKLIPTSGIGAPATNYDETEYGYDVMKRQYRTVTPGGTITDLVFETRGLTVGVWVGTGDTGATPDDPSGGGASGNNMVLITTNVYDGGASGGNGNLTQQIQQVDASTTRTTTMTYDFRDRLLTTDGEIDYFEKLTYDNLNQITQVDRYNTTAAGNLIGRSVTAYDDQGRVYQTIRYAVDPSTGTLGNTLTDNTWYDASGNVIKSFPAGSQLFTKATYDGVGRTTFQYAAYGTDSTYANVGNVASNTVIEQVETTYDADSNVIQTTIRQRYHNAPTTQLGSLGSPSATPNARVSYTALYPDGIGRVVNAANYGTNGGTALTRPATAPARSDTILVNSALYDATGKIATTTDPAGLVNAFGYDGRGRDIIVTENSGGSSGGGTLCTASDDTNRITQMTYTSDNRILTLVAKNSRTGDQTTTYFYGTTLDDSKVAMSVLLRYVEYPGSVNGSDRVAYAYNRQSERISFTDQRGCVHSYVYDLLGRLTNDCVTTLGAGVDGAVRRLAVAYEVRGMMSKLTSYDNPTVGSGSIVNEVALTYNSFGQLVADAQSHSGAVVPGTTPKVQYAYANGSGNTIRPTTLTYPNGRAITTNYGTAGGINDSLSRIDGLIDGSTTLVNYAYLGMSVPVQTTYPQPGIQYTLVNTGTSPAGDIYWGLDRFGRIIDSRWYNTATSQDLDRIKYGYDRASNRIWRQNPVATAAGAAFDEFYTNDGLQRLKDMQRGTLNGTNTGIPTPNFKQCWTLDPTGNWMGFNESTNGSTWTLNQTRAANPVNEITTIGTTTGTQWAIPTYDTAGNMVNIPITTGSLTSNGWQDLTVDQWASLTVDGWSTLPVGGTTNSYTATYDAWNRMTKLVDTLTGNTVQQSQYDARTFRTVIQTYTSGVLTETRHSYFTASWRCIEERTGTMASSERQFVWGARYIDDIVSRDRDSERLYAMQDANWNVTSIANTAATVQERYSYSGYGLPIYLNSTFGATTSSFTWETLFCGYRFDTVLNLLRVRYRTFHPSLGTWLQRDPAGYLDTMNLYEYVSGFPQGMIDPYGLGARSDAMGEIAASMGIPRPTTTPADARFNEGFAIIIGAPVFVSTIPASAAQGTVNTANAGLNSIISLINIPLAAYASAVNLYQGIDGPDGRIPHQSIGADLFVEEDPQLRKLGGELGLAGLTLASFARTCSSQLSQKIWVATTRPGGFEGDTLVSGAAGRVWATSRNPEDWAKAEGIWHALQRMWYFGKAARRTDFVEVTGAARDQFLPVIPRGPLTLYKWLSQQFTTTIPGSLNLRTGEIGAVATGQSFRVTGSFVAHTVIDITFTTAMLFNYLKDRNKQ